MMDTVVKNFGNRIRVRACGILIENDALLLVEHKGLNEHNSLWIPPGGGIEFGETAIEALKREFKEETHLDINVGELLCIGEFISAKLHALELFFMVSLISGKLSKGIDPEIHTEEQIIKSVRFVPFQEIRIMKKEVLHGILHSVDTSETLLNMKGYFKF